jgi:outer membrane protein assembly factor BamA
MSYMRNPMAGIKKATCTALFAALALLSRAIPAAPDTATSTAHIDTVMVTGAADITRSAADSLFLSKRGGVLNDGLIAHDRGALETHLRENGWWSARVEASVDTSGGRTALVFRASSGARVRFGNVRLRAGETLPNSFVAPAPDLRGKPFKRVDLDGVIEALLSRLAQNGYSGAAVVPLLNARVDTVDVALDLSPGIRAQVDSIAVRGLATTKESVVLRELAWLKGRPVSPEIGEFARAAVGRLRFLGVAADPAVEYGDDGRAVLVVPVAEGNRSSFDGVLGYQPRANGGPGQIIGKADLEVENLFGTGRSARVRWENLGGSSQDMELHYEEPWVFGFPYAAEGTFMQERRPDQGYTRTLLSAGANHSIGRFSARVGFRSETVSADSLLSSVAAGIEAGASWAALDDPANPRSGSLYSAEWSTVRKNYRYSAENQSSLTRTVLGWEQYVPVSRSQVLAFLLGYRRIDTGNRIPDPADKFWLGGASTIRGYRERAFPADKALLVTVEYRFLAGPSSRVFLFTDYGRLWNRERIADRTVDRSSTHVGYGFGLRLRSPGGTLGFDYGFGKGDSPGEGKLHVRLSTEF